MRWTVFQVGPDLDERARRASFDAHFPVAPASVLLAPRTAGGATPLAELVRWLREERACEVGLSADALALPGLTELATLARAGLSALLLDVPIEASTPALRAALPAAREALASPLPLGAGRRFPAAEIDARLLLDVRAIAAPAAVQTLADGLLPLVDVLRLDLWPRRARNGRLALPPLPALRRLVAQLLARAEGGWPEGLASVGLGAWSGFPACLFDDAGERLRWFRLGHLPDCAGAAVPPRPGLPPSCGGCALRTWCPPALAGAEGEEYLRSWAPDLRSFLTVPPGLLPDPGAAAAVDGYIPRHRRQPYRAFAREDADGFLWGVRAARRIVVGPADLPPPPPPAVAAGYGVLLVRVPGSPRFEEQGSATLVPLSLVHLSSLLAARGFPVDVIDLVAEAHAAGLQDPGQPPAEDALRTFCRERLERALAAPRPAPLRLVGWSAEYREPAELALELSALVPPEVHVVLGGRAIGPRLDAHEALRRCPRLDFVVEGEGELPLALLAGALAEGRAPRAVPGLNWRHAGRIVRLPSASHELAALAGPCLDWVDPALYPNERRDNRRAFGDGPVATYMFVRGCPFRCAFCGDYSAGRISARPVAQVGADLERLVARYGMRSFVFLDTLINPTRRYLMELLDELERRHLPIRFVDSAKPRALGREDLARLRAVGCTMLTWGIDAGSERLAGLMRKGVSLAEATGVLRAAHEAGITNTINLIQGLPHETADDVAQTIRWLRENRPYLWRVRVQRYEFLANSPLYLFPEQFGIAKRPDGRSFDEVDGLPWEERQAAAEDSLRRVEGVVRELQVGWA